MSTEELVAKLNSAIERLTYLDDADVADGWTEQTRSEYRMILSEVKLAVSRGTFQSCKYRAMNLDRQLDFCGVVWGKLLNTCLHAFYSVVDANPP